MNGIDNIILGVSNLFVDINGSNPYYIGVSYVIAIVLYSLLLLVMGKRTTITMSTHNIIAFVGCTLFLLRYILLFIFDWGTSINAFNDQLIFMILPPLEHFFYAIGIICFSYYSLIIFNYYPGLLKKVILLIPIFLTSFFIYSTIVWKHQYITDSTTLNYVNIGLEWKLHFILTIIALYTTITSFVKLNIKNIFLYLFWYLVLSAEILSAIFSYYHSNLLMMATLFKSVQIWGALLLILHFSTDIFHMFKLVLNTLTEEIDLKSKL